MARIQSKTSGRRPKRPPLYSHEIRKSAEESLINRGIPSKSWKAEKGNPSTSSSPKK